MRRSEHLKYYLTCQEFHGAHRLQTDGYQAPGFWHLARIHAMRPASFQGLPRDLCLFQTVLGSRDGIFILKDLDLRMCPSALQRSYTAETWSPLGEMLSDSTSEQTSLSVLKLNILSFITPKNKQTTKQTKPRRTDSDGHCSFKSHGCDSDMFQQWTLYVRLYHQVPAEIIPDDSQTRYGVYM